MGWLNKITGVVSAAPLPLPVKLAALALDFGARVATDAIKNRPITAKRLLNNGMQTLGASSFPGKTGAVIQASMPIMKSVFNMGIGGIPNSMSSSITLGSKVAKAIPMSRSLTP